MKINYKRIVWQIVAVIGLILLLIVIKNWDAFIEGFNAA